MIAPTAISKEEYSSTGYHPDLEWVDGVLIGRNVGTQLHALVQRILATYLSAFRKSHRVEVFVEARLQVGNRTRIPDVLVLKAPYTKSKITVDVPLIVIEVKSPDDTFDEVVEKCFEYAALGIPFILVVDPDHRRMYRFSAGSLTAATKITVPMEPGDIEIEAHRLFAEADEE